MAPSQDMTPPMSRSSARSRRGQRAGMTLVEVILAIVILSGTMLGLGNFARKFQSSNAGSTSKSLASDLAAQRIADIQSYRPYSSIVASYNGTSESFTTGVYKGFTRATTAAPVSPTGWPSTTPSV